MGEAQKLSPEEQIRSAREGFDAGKDFTVAVEEEFAILDPRSLGLVNRFEDFQAAAQGTEVEEHLVGELIASEVEVRTGRCETFADAAAVMVERRRQLLELAGRLDLALCATGTHPWSPWQEQRIIDTPHYRRNDEVLRYVVWRNNTFGLHVHVGIKGADRAILVTNALRGFLPDLLAYSGSSPFVEGVYTYLHSARTEVFTRMFPRCGVPDAFRDWAEYEDYVRFLYDTESITEHTQLWWSVRPHLAFPTVELRICDGAARARRVAGTRSVDVRADRADRARDRRGRGAAGPPAPPDRGEPLARHPPRPLGRADRPANAATSCRRARGSSSSSQWTMPVAEELGVASFLTVPAATPAERQIAQARGRAEHGGDLRRGGAGSRPCLST